MLVDISATALVNFHDHSLSELPWPAALQRSQMPPVWCAISANHVHNMLLWKEEDKARRTDVDASVIAASKRLIDQHNQKRNDAVEAIDEELLTALGADSPASNARLHSETAGAMIDRLSILSLKIHHMRKQTQRIDADFRHLEACRAKLLRLRAQRQDLAHCFDRLLEDVQEGRAYFKVYRQYKMYNDPALNPYLAGAQRGRSTERAGA